MDKKPLDFVAVLVLLLVERGRFDTVGNYHLNPFFSVISPVFIAAIAHVGDNLARREAGPATLPFADNPRPGCR